LPHSPALARSVWPFPGAERDHHDRGAGLLQYQRGAGPAANQGDPAALYLLRRLVIVRDAGERERAAEHQPADGMREIASSKSRPRTRRSIAQRKTGRSLWLRPKVEYQVKTVIRLPQREAWPAIVFTCWPASSLSGFGGDHSRFSFRASGKQHGA